LKDLDEIGDGEGPQRVRSVAAQPRYLADPNRFALIPDMRRATPSTLKQCSAFSEQNGRRIMETVNETSAVTPRCIPWNKGKLIGPKPPLQPKHVWAIRIRLQLAERTRDLVH
jgi:hypothetical protein